MTGFNPRAGGGTIRHPSHVEAAVPSPFPGMDPYLENPPSWMGFHNKLVVEIETALNGLIQPAYYADIEERVYILSDTDPARRQVVPDIKIVRTGKPGKVKPGRGRNPSGGLAVCEPVTVVTLLEDEVSETYVKVVERATGRVVTLIEVLSPANKLPGSAAHGMYIDKRNAVVRSDTSLVEIDLLRDGRSPSAGLSYPEHEYLVYVSKKSGRPNARIWPIRLTQRLPVIPVPLGGKDPDVDLDLQPLLDTIYDRGPYAVKLDYRADPVPPLPPDLAKWADALLRKKKLR